MRDYTTQNSKNYKFVYQTKNIINGKTYIGVHATNNLNDGYIGCGVTSNSKADSEYRRLSKISAFIRAVNKYRYNNFKLEIMGFYHTYEECLEEEKFLVDEAWVKSDSNYNSTIGGNVTIITGANHYKSYNIIAYDITGTLIKQFNCCREASEYTGCNINSINRVVLGKSKHSRFIRFYKKSSFIEVPKIIDPLYYNLDEIKNRVRSKPVRNTSTKVVAYDCYGNYIDIFCNSIEAANTFKTSRGVVSSVINGKKYHHKSIRFKYSTNTKLDLLSIGPHKH